METGSVTTEILGKSFDEVEQKLGDPIQEDRFELGVVVSEFRIELTNLFDETQRTQNPPNIREVTWSLSPDENLTIWFSKSEETDWRAIHVMSWHPDDQF
ncbi:hypothetical protein Q5Y75_16215 [Ruegeria sp. 2205SS24-7]|uniref:hypothetical protein n=1 Tax=Ruegeria discodermiae TaxID=3064389 RepID=UPI0027413509|nr:hypothetical protein [Ruegeria sp. 2205SS24-7]MDP5218775.1 hypothetical protein [Ruegeria sp. 2205SS24-7]